MSLDSSVFTDDFIIRNTFCIFSGRRSIAIDAIIVNDVTSFFRVIVVQSIKNTVLQMKVKIKSCLDFSFSARPMQLTVNPPLSNISQIKRYHTLVKIHHKLLFITALTTLLTFQPVYTLLTLLLLYYKITLLVIPSLSFRGIRHSECGLLSELVASRVIRGLIFLSDNNADPRGQLITQRKNISLNKFWIYLSFLIFCFRNEKYQNSRACCPKKVPTLWMVCENSGRLITFAFATLSKNSEYLRCNFLIRDHTNFKAILSLRRLIFTWFLNINQTDAYVSESYQRKNIHGSPSQSLQIHYHLAIPRK